MTDPAELFSLSGKRALITGASRGIGRAIALAYAQSGADVAVLARSQDELEQVAGEIREAGRSAIALTCDVTQPPEVEAAVTRTTEELGGLDVLVNNAGGPVFNAPFLDTRPEGFRRVLELNLLSVVWFCHAAGRHMVAQRSGSIINVDSIGSTHPAPMVAAYCAAKAGVVNLTQTLAQEWGAAAVRINALSPGMVDTKINQAMVGHPEIGPAIEQIVPLGRWGTPEDLVGAAVWLASEASAYVTGALIPVNGGIGVVAPQRRPDWVRPAQ